MQRLVEKGQERTWASSAPAADSPALPAVAPISWTASLASGKPETLTPETIADGTTAPVDARNLELLREVVDRWIDVPEERLRPKIAELAQRAKVVAEGAGVLGFAALEDVQPGPATVAVVSGGNLSAELLAEALSAGP